MKKVLVKIEINTPNTQTLKNFNTAFEAIEYLLEHCTPDERIDLFSDYCKWCGTDKLPCYCNRDE